MKTAIMTNDNINYTFSTAPQQQPSLVATQRFASPVRPSTPMSQQIILNSPYQKTLVKQPQHQQPMLQPAATTTYVTAIDHQVPSPRAYAKQLQPNYITQNVHIPQQQSQHLPINYATQYVVDQPVNPPSFFAHEVPIQQQIVSNQNLVYSAVPPQPQQQQQYPQYIVQQQQQQPPVLQQQQQIVVSQQPSPYQSVQVIPEMRQYTSQQALPPQQQQQQQQPIQLVKYVQQEPVHHQSQYQFVSQEPPQQFAQKPANFFAPIEIPAFSQQQHQNNIHQTAPIRPAYTEFNGSHYEFKRGDIDADTRTYVETQLNSRGRPGLQRHLSSTFIPDTRSYENPQFFTSQYQPVERTIRLGSPQREYTGFAVNTEPSAVFNSIQRPGFPGNHSRAVQSQVGFGGEPNIYERNPRLRLINSNNQYTSSEDFLRARDIGYIFQKRTQDYLKEYFQAIIDIEREIEANRFKLVKQDDYSVQLFYEIFDATERGQIFVEDILRGLSKLGINADTNDVHLLVQRYSLSKTAQLDQQEFINMVVPQTYKHIDAIFQRKPFVSERNIKEETKRLMTKVMKGLLNAEVVLETLRQKFLDQNINPRELYAIMQDNPQEPMNRQNFREFLMKSGIFVNKEEMTSVMQRFDAKDMGFFRESDFEAELRPRMR